MWQTQRNGPTRQKEPPSVSFVRSLLCGSAHLPVFMRLLSVLCECNQYEPSETNTLRTKTHITEWQAQELTFRQSDTYAFATAKHLIHHNTQHTQTNTQHPHEDGQTQCAAPYIIVYIIFPAMRRQSAACKTANAVPIAVRQRQQQCGKRIRMSRMHDTQRITKTTTQNNTQTRHTIICTGCAHYYNHECVYLRTQTPSWHTSKGTFMVPYRCVCGEQCDRILARQQR